MRERRNSRLSGAGVQQRRLRLAGGIVVVAVVNVAALLGVAAATGARLVRAAAPTNTAAPTIDGKFQVGETLTASNGQWANSPAQYSYQWQQCNDSGSGCANISGATGKTYVAASADVGHTLVVLVTAANPDGTATAASPATPVISGSEAPRNSDRPTISGSAIVGESLQVSTGQWSGGVTSYAYQWQQCDQNGDNCANVAGATGSSYNPRSADLGKTLRADVTAVNAAGRTTVNTDRSAAVTAAAGAAGSGCTGGGSTVDAASIALPTRLQIDKFSFDPNPLTRSARSLTGRFHVSDTCNRSVSNAHIWATAIPYNQTSLEETNTGSDGWATITFKIQAGFPANPGRQQILAVLVRATQPGGSIVAGVSTRLVVRENVNLR